MSTNGNFIVFGSSMIYTDILRVPQASEVDSDSYYSKAIARRHTVEHPDLTISASIITKV
jgi:hypothetical protein